MDKVSRAVEDAVFAGFDTREANRHIENLDPTEFRFVRMSPSKMRISIRTADNKHRFFVVEVKEEVTK